MRKNEIIDFKKGEKPKLLRLLRKYKNFKLYDFYENLYIQYKIIKNPEDYFLPKDEKNKLIRKIKESFNKTDIYTKGSWVVLHSQNEIYHLLKKTDYLQYRTIRNRNLITSEEQNILYNKKILFVGLSVGSQVLTSFVRTGIGNNFVIIDADEVDIHNMNRTNFFLQDLGKKKVNIIKKQILSIDPYLNVLAVDDYLDDRNVNALLKGVDLIIDSFDDFSMKIKLRKFAKKFKIPVLSGFDISKGAMVIVERYDVEDDLDLKFYLNGYTEENILSLKEKSIVEKTKIFIKVIGEKYHDKKMLDSVLSVGKQLTGYPQLSIATSLSASLWTVAAIDILLGTVKKSLRVYVNLEDLIYKM